MSTRGVRNYGSLTGYLLALPFSYFVAYRMTRCDEEKEELKRPGCYLKMMAIGVVVLMISQKILNLWLEVDVARAAVRFAKSAKKSAQKSK